MKILFNFIIFTLVLSAEDVEECSINQIDNCGSNVSKYTEGNRIFREISNALRDYKQCSDEDCQCYTSVIEKDLKPFQKNGIEAGALDSITDRGTKYQIINHKLYRQKTCMFPARCSGIEYFIKSLLSQLPDMEMIINCRDWPQQPKNYAKNVAPIFSFSKTHDYLDIMYPAWSFWEGGPAISLYPTGIGRWDLHRERISAISDEKFPWNKKKMQGFFRGSRTSDERDSLILLSRKQNQLIDAQYTKNQAWKSPKDTLNAEPAKEISFEEHCKYKYLFNFRGVAASFRLKHLFLCKSLVFHVGNDWQEFFYSQMKPWVHYIPLKSYPSEKDIQTLLDFFKEHDELAEQIAERGFEFIWNHLAMDDVKCYWKELLLEYGKIIKYNVNLDKKFIEIN